MDRPSGVCISPEGLLVTTESTFSKAALHFFIFYILISEPIPLAAPPPNVPTSYRRLE